MQNVPAAAAASCRASRSRDYPVEAQATVSTSNCTCPSGPTGISGAFCYNADLFDAATDASVWPSTTTLLEACGRQPGDATLPSCRSLGDGRAPAVLVVDGTPRRRRTRASRRSTRLFAAQVARTPDAAAVMFETDAHLPRAQRAGQPARPSTCERGRAAPRCSWASAWSVLDMVVAILGVLKARRRLRARSIRGTRRAARIHARRRHRVRVLLAEAGRRDAAAGRRARGHLPGPRLRRRSTPRAGRSRERRSTARQPGLRDLHVGLDGPAQGRGGAAPRL